MRSAPLSFAHLGFTSRWEVSGQAGVLHCHLSRLDRLVAHQTYILLPNAHIDNHE